LENRALCFFSTDVRNINEWAKRTRVPLTTADALGATYARSHRWLHALKSDLIYQHHWLPFACSDPRAQMLFSLGISQASIGRPSAGLQAGPIDIMMLQLPIQFTSFFSPERRVQWEMVFHSDIFGLARKICPPINDILNLMQCLLTGMITLVFEKNLPRGISRTTRGLPPVTWIQTNEQMLVEIFGISHFRALRKACGDTATACKVEVVPYPSSIM
ncbi:hypothetical protein GGX14DRAFT_370555, partial [Mycena pura]